MATQISILVWEIPWTEVPGELQSMGLQGHDLVTKQSKKQTNKQKYIYIYICIYIYSIYFLRKKEKMPKLYPFDGHAQLPTFSFKCQHINHSLLSWCPKLKYLPQIEALCLNLSTINSNTSTLFIINCECFSFLSTDQVFMFCRFARSMCWIQGWILLCISKQPVWDDVPLSSKDHTISSN